MISSGFGENTMMLIFLIIKEVFIISFYPISLNFDACLHIDMYGYKIYQSIKWARASITMMNNNDITI